MASKSMNGKKNVAFPIIARYNYAIRYFIEQAMGQNYIMAPRMTRKTMELGAKYAPDMVCTPFKTILGSLIECLESGADTLIMTMGVCRLGYYGELAEQILHDLGFEFDYVNFAEFTTGKNKDYLKALRKISPDIKPVRAVKDGLDALKMVEYIDEVERIYYENCGFETERGAYRKALNRFYHDMDVATTYRDITTGYSNCRMAFDNIPVDKGRMPIRVGVIGEYFTVMDEFSNLDLEQTLADMGVEVHRWMNLTHRNIHYPGEKRLNLKIHDYCKYEMGPTSTANIWCAKYYAEQGYDGIVHLKSAGCTPEIDIMPVLQRIGEEYKIPILYLTYDTQTAATGLITRLEAFYDMMDIRKRVMG